MALLLLTQRSRAVAWTFLPLDLVVMSVPLPVKGSLFLLASFFHLYIQDKVEVMFSTKHFPASPAYNWLFFSEPCSSIFSALLPVLSTCALCHLALQLCVLSSGAEHPAPVFSQLISDPGQWDCRLIKHCTGPSGGPEWPRPLPSSEAFDHNAF